MTASTPQDESLRTRLERRLTRTYTRGRGAWAQVRNYRQVMRYIEAHPDAGATEVARECDQPPSRVRPWLAGTEPDAVRALAVADGKGWLDTSWEMTASYGVNAFVAWVYSGGSVSTDTYVPQFTLADDLAENVARRAFRAVDLDYHLDRAGEAGRSTEAVPAIHGSIFGRTLVAWGAPAGPKYADADLSLAAYLDDAPRSVRLDFARVYALNRATTRYERPELPLQLSEQRSNDYLAELVAFFGSLVDETAVKPAGDDTIYFLPDAEDELYMPPTLGEA